jgi:hypothetical protein
MGSPQEPDARRRRVTEGSRSRQWSQTRLEVVTKLSPWSVADTVTRLFAVAAARGLKVLAKAPSTREVTRSLGTFASTP